MPSFLLRPLVLTTVTSGLQEGCGYADCTVEQAARVVAQVEDDAFERTFVFFDKGLRSFVECGNSALLELGDADVAVVFSSR